MPLHMPATLLAEASAGGGFSLTYTDTGSSNTSQTTYTFSGKALGDADSGRVIVIAVGYTDGGGSSSISSVTVGGVTATVRVASEPTAYCRSYIYTAAVPSGTTGDVVVTFGSVHSSHTCFVALWRLVGASNEDPGVSGFEATGSAADVTAGASLQIPTGGAGVGIATFTPSSGNTNRSDFVAGSSTTAGTATRTATYSNGGPDCTWTNLTEDAQAMYTAAIDSNRVALALASWSP